MSGFSIIVDSVDVSEMLGGLSGRISDLTPAMKNIGEYMVREREKLFAGEHDPEGAPWKPLKIRTLYSGYGKQKYTKKGKVAKGFMSYLTGRKILTKDHQLRTTVYAADALSVRISPDKNAEDYAAIHQFGGMAGRNRAVEIPARPHLGLNEENRNEIRRILMDVISRTQS